MATPGLETRRSTDLAALPPAALDRRDHVARRLGESVAARSFLALGVDATRLDRTATLLHTSFAAITVDVTQVLLEEMRAEAARVGLPWDLVRAADAAAPGSRDAAGLAALVAWAVPALDTAIEAAGVGAPEGSRPVLLTEVAPLARYGHLARLGRWTDLATRRRQAVWLLVPQLAAVQGAMIDIWPLPLAAPGQFLRLGRDWLPPERAGAASGPTPRQAEGAHR